MLKGILFGKGGSATRSIRRWWHQRLSAVALLPLSLWLIYDLSTLASLEYAAVRAWLAAPSTMILFILLIPALFYHAQIGMQEIVEDYIINERCKHAAITSIRFLAALCALISILSVMAVNL